MFRIPARLTRGTIEEVEVPITDNTGTTTDLSATSPTFEVFESDLTTSVQGPDAATATGMTIHCLCDTTGWGTTETNYKLYVTFTIGTETPRLGPFDIYVND